MAIDARRGLSVAALRSANGRSASRYDRHSVSREESDPGDALVLANILRTDMHADRVPPANSDLARAITALAHAQQDAAWNRQHLVNQVRSLLREHYPAALDASGEKKYVGRRFIKNNRLISAGFLLVFFTLRTSPGADTHCRRRREQGDSYAQPQRHLFNRLIGQLYHCLQTGQLLDKHRAFTSSTAQRAVAA